MRKTSSLLLLAICLHISLIAAESKLETFIKSIPGVSYEKKDSSAYSEFYIVRLPQLVDHLNPGGELFSQKIFIGHRAYDRPVVLETEGYGAEWVNAFTQTEPSMLLNANMIYVEHRYFGESVPKNRNWKYLTAEQDAADYHYIRNLFANIYPGKWIASGVSKGGQTSIEYKLYYPQDVDVTIPYVAPVNFSRLDKRIDKHFNKVGTRDQRKHIKAIQYYLYRNKSSVIPVWNAIAEANGMKFTTIDSESAYDFSVLEFPFSFWQYTADESKLPDLQNTTLEKMALFLIQIVSPFWYTEAADVFEAASYQFYTQLGYYEYDERPFRKYLKNRDYSNASFVPRDAQIVWDPGYQNKLKAFFKSNPANMIFIYGEADPWGATSAPVKPGAASLKMVQKNGTHGAQISTLSAEQQALVKSTLTKWLGIIVE